MGGEIVQAVARRTERRLAQRPLGALVRPTAGMKQSGRAVVAALDQGAVMLCCGDATPSTDGLVARLGT